MNREEIIKRSKDIHGDKFDYSLVEDAQRRNKIKIICPTHGEFEQFVGNHISGRGCRNCENDSRRKLPENIIDELRDKIKDDYCVDNKIKLIRISNQNDIENILKKELDNEN